MIYTVTTVGWCDHAHCFEDTPADEVDLSPVNCISSGVLIEENDESITLSLMLYLAGSRETVRMTQVILNTDIKWRVDREHDLTDSLDRRG